MNQQPDKLFRDKLQDHQKPAPSSAWEKISAAQQKKKHDRGWWKIAASFLLVAGAAYIFWPSGSATTNEGDLVANEVRDNNNEAIMPITDSADRKDTVSPDEVLTKIGKAPSAKKQMKKIFKAPHQSPALAVIDAPVQTQPDIDVLKTDSALQKQPVAAGDIALIEKENSSKSITLSYSAEETSKYLNKKELDEATSESRKPSTLKKLLQKASDLKNNQDPLGDLRQMKNEILALNFKSEKQRGQNK